MFGRAKAVVYDDGGTDPRRSTPSPRFNWRFAQPYGTDCIIGDPNTIDWHLYSMRYQGAAQ
jgi:hypothetical protein